MTSQDLSTFSFVFAGVFLLFLFSSIWAKVSSEKDKLKFIEKQKEREINQER